MGEWLASIRLRLRALTRRSQLERELEDELRFHTEMREQDLRQSGLTADEARDSAQKSFGNATLALESTREVWGFTWAETACRDVGYAVRALRRSPGLVIAAVVSLGLGIGVNTTVYSLVDAALLNDVTARDPASIVRIEAGRIGEISYLNLQDLRNDGIMDGLAGFTPRPDVNLRWGDETNLVFCEVVTDNFFQVLGVPAALGRTFTAEAADARREPRVAVVSYGFWKRRLGGDPEAVGRLIHLQGQPFTVVGVLPEGYRSVIGHGVTPAIYVPVSKLFVSTMEARGAADLKMIGRLPDGVSRRQAGERLLVSLKRLERLYPEQNRELGRIRKMTGLAGLDRYAKDLDARVIVLFSSVLLVLVWLVLIIASSNVAGLLLVRAAGRGREIAIRLALGSSRGRLIRLLLCEGFLVAALGTACGLLLNLALTRVLSAVRLPANLPVELHVSPDHRLFLYSVFLTVVTTLFCALTPALRSTRLAPAAAMKHSEPSISWRRMAMRNGLVAGQVAGSIVLVLTAFLFLRSLMRMASADPGFEVNRTLTLRVRPVPGKYPGEKFEAFRRQVLEQVAQTPGVEAVAPIGYPPLSLEVYGPRVRIEGAAESDAFGVNAQPVGPGYFAAMRIPILRGRDFMAEERAVAVINETFARRHFPNQNPLGRRLLVANRNDWQPHEVIAVTRDSKFRYLGEGPTPLLYLPASTLHLVVRTAGPPSAALPALRQTIARLDSAAAVQTQPMQEQITLSLWPTRFASISLAILGALGLVLAAVGLYGTTAYTVSRRTAEIGVRMALGASPRSVLAMVLGDGLGLAGIGIAFGLAVAALVTRPLAWLLAEGVAPADPISFFLTVVLLVAAAVLACIVPARRAMRVEPMTALRYE